MKRSSIVLVQLIVAALAFAHAGEMHTYMGTITALRGEKSFTMKLTNGKSITVETAKTTKYLHAGDQSAKPGELAAGMRVVVKMAKDGKTAISVKMSASPATPILTIVDALHAAGLKLKPAGTLHQPFFGVPAHVFTIEGGDVQLHEFKSAAVAQTAASRVAPRGGSIGTIAMSWMAPPHFFRKDRVIAIYIGLSREPLPALEKVFGPQFAGQ